MRRTARRPAALTQFAVGDERLEEMDQGHLGAIAVGQPGEPIGAPSRAPRQMQMDGVLPTQQRMASIANDGTITYHQMPDVQLVDYVTRSLNDARNALDFGASMLSPSVARDEVASTLQGMTGPEPMHVRGGVRAHIADTLGNVQRTLSDPNVDARQTLAGVKMPSSDAAQDKLGMRVGPDEARSGRRLPGARR